MKTPAIRIGLVLAIVGAFLLPACGGGSSGGSSNPSDKAAPALALVDVNVSGYVGVALNKIIKFEFSADLDPDTVRPDTIQIREGPGYGIQVPGYFEVDGSVVYFYPRLPVLADLSDGGLHAGKSYRITLPGYPAVATVRSFSNGHLAQTTTEDFQTALASSSTLFVDNFLDPLPPQIIAVNPPDGATDVAADSKITLTFNRRPLHPGTVTDTNIRLFMESRLGEPQNRPLPIDPVLVQTHDSVQVIVQPKFPLADQATYRIEIDRRVQDLVGNDLQPPPGEGMYVTRFSVRDEPFRYASMTLTFDEKEKQDIMDVTETTASWNEAQPGAVAALFTVAGGNGTAGDLNPKSSQNLSPDNYKRGVEVMVKDGVEYDVYNFRSISIPTGVSVRFQPRSSGPNRPAILLSLKNIEIAGTLTVSGGVGQPGEGTNYSTSAIPLAKGGKAGPGGGNGSDNDTGDEFYPPPETNGESVPYGGGGGDGGGAGSYTYSYYGSSTYYYKYAYSYTSGGGAGGGSRTRGTKGGDGTYPSAGYYGLGGKGGLSTTDRGYLPNYERNPNVGGAGGGAGCKGFYDYYYYTTSSTSRSQYYGGAGSGGGGGGGIWLQSAGDVHMASTGAIYSDGGDGGASGQYYVYSGGAGGGGAGGSVKLVATAEVNLDAGATISVRGGKGGLYAGTYTYYHPGIGGDGGDGYIRLEAIEKENSPGKPTVNGVSTANLSYGPPSTGVFAPQGGGAPSVAQTLWMNVGVYDPVMMKPDATDIDSTLYNDSMSIEVQMAVEDSVSFGNPDLSALDVLDLDGDGQRDDTLNTATLSEWTPLTQIDKLNGRHYQYIRVRIVFQLDPSQVASDPLPYLDSLTLPFGF
jgi:hypothetical protein